MAANQGSIRDMGLGNHETQDANVRLRLSFVLILAALLASGCVFSPADVAVRRLNHQAEASGSPYRYRDQYAYGGWVVEKYRIIPPVAGPIPKDLKPTSANSQVQKDVLTNIASLQKEWGCDVAPLLLGVKPLGETNNSTMESWFDKQGSGAIQYEVSMTPSAEGGTDLQIEGP
jgi:hypothetical protein